MLVRTEEKEALSYIHGWQVQIITTSKEDKLMICIKITNEYTLEIAVPQTHTLTGKMKLLTEALFVIAKIWKQPVCLPIADWLNSSTSIEMEYYKKR